MLILFFDSKNVIHCEYVFEGQTVNATFCVQVLDHLCNRTAYVKPEMWRDRKFFRLYDNSRLHTATIIQQILAKKGVTKLSYPPYSPDLSQPPLDYFAFSKLGLELKGDH